MGGAEWCQRRGRALLPLCLNLSPSCTRSTAVEAVWQKRPLLFFCLHHRRREGVLLPLAPPSHVGGRAREAQQQKHSFPSSSPGKAGGTRWGGPLSLPSCFSWPVRKERGTAGGSMGNLGKALPSCPPPHYSPGWKQPERT